MSDSESQNSGLKRRRSDQKRLGSWKAIATYLNRSVRTVRRWEADEGLPVHRHKHSKGCSVHAYAVELDVWRNEKYAPQDSELQISSVAKTDRRLPVWIAYATVVVVVVFVSGRIIQPLFDADPSPTPAAANNDWLLIATPTTSSDNLESIGESLRAALRRELSRLPSYRVLSEQSLQEYLRLMRLDPLTALTPERAREVALRDGRTGALLIPQVEQLGEVYVLSVEVIDPGTGLLITYPSAKVEDINDVHAAMEQLARDVESGLSQRQGTLATARLSRVTTSSMSALLHFSQAARLLRNNRPIPAYELLSLALTEDPDFVSAQALQAWALRRSGASLDAYLPIARLAADSASRISTDERYFIEGSHLYFSGDRIRAAANFVALLESRPDHLPGAQALLDLCVDSQPPAGCGYEAERLSELRADDIAVDAYPSWPLVEDTAGSSRTHYFAERSLQIMREEGDGIVPEIAARALIFPVIATWIGGDLRGASLESRKLREELPMLPDETKNLLIRHLASFSLMLGQIDESRNLVALLSDPSQSHGMQARILFALGDMQGLRVHLTTGGDVKDRMTILLMSMSGLTEEAITLQRELSPGKAHRGQAAVIHAIEDISDGRHDSAKQRLQIAITELTDEDQAYYLVAADLLSGIFKSEGDLPGAIGMLETTMPWRNEAAFNKAGIFWLVCQRKLARLYRQAGRENDAARIEKDLRNMLILSDEDFPLSLSLQDV